MAEDPDRAAPGAGLWAVVKKRWRGWLRAFHRDFGYVAVGFTVIYALSGLAINHIADWDPNFVATERTMSISLPATTSVEEANARIADAIGLGTPNAVARTGDELRLTYDDGTTATVIGDHVTVQARSSRFFFRVANWLHYNRGKKAWTYVADVYAVMLLYLAISGIFMIKGKLGLRWRGAVLVSLGVAVPLVYVLASGGPEAANKAEPARVADKPPPRIETPAAHPETPKPASDKPVLTPLPDDDNGR